MNSIVCAPRDEGRKGGKKKSVEPIELRSYVYLEHRIRHHGANLQQHTHTHKTLFFFFFVSRRVGRPVIRLMMKRAEREASAHHLLGVTVCQVALLNHHRAIVELHH